MKLKKYNTNKNYKRILILTFGILLLAFVDIIVLERIYRPMSVRYNIPWKEFEIYVFSSNTHALWWHIAFIPLGIALFTLIGFSGNDWKLALSGIVLFATGLEDITYYLIQLKKIPQQLPWLDINPSITWTRILTGSTHVTNVGLFISAIIGIVLTVVILDFHKRLKYFNFIKLTWV